MTQLPWQRGYVPPMKSVMTPFPYSIASEDSIAAAARMMAEHDIRHLPVQDRGQVVGVVSERNLRTLQLSRPEVATRQHRTVAEAMIRPAYVVGINSPLDEVLAELSERHIGCAVVMRDDRLVGIFTTMDACRLFALQLGYTPPADDDIA